MNPRLLRYAIPLPLLAMALLNGVFVFQIVSTNVRAIRHYTRVPGTIRATGSDPLIEVELLQPGVDRGYRKTVMGRTASAFFLDFLDNVTGYVDPTGKSPPRLAGFFNLWLAPLLLSLESLVLLAAACFLWKLDHSRGWAWCSPAPWPPPADDLMARYPRSSAYACLFWSSFGLALAV